MRIKHVTNAYVVVTIKDSRSKILIWGDKNDGVVKF